MSKYYKAEDVIRAIEEMQNGYNGWSDRFDKAQIIGVLEELPTIDIVRCDECSERDFCSFEFIKTVNGYCNFGERIDNE